MRAALALLLSASAAHAFVGTDGDVEPRRASAITLQPSIEVSGATADAAIAERAARAYLAKHLATLAPGARASDFVLAANRLDDGKRTVAFFQTWRGLRVVGGQLHVVFANDRLFAVTSRALPDVTAVMPAVRVPSLARVRGAQARATGERVVLRVDGGYRVAHVVDARDGLHAWDVYVDSDGEPLARTSRVHFAQSTLLVDVGERYASGTRAARAAPDLQIVVDGSSTTTTADGTFTWPTSNPATVAPTLTGTFVRVFDEAGIATASLTAQPGQPLTWSAAGNELFDAQLSAYIYASAAKVAGRRINPGLPYFDQQLEVHVNLASTCNALSTGDSIHFFRAGGECENTARVADVVHHEFGHSFHRQSLIPGAGEMHSSILEGLADFFAANMSEDSGIGRGFFFNNAAVREIDPVGSERVYPTHVTGQAHTTGLIIAGALWDLRKQLIARLGATAGRARAEKIFLGVVQRAGDVTETYQAALVADDDDGNLANGTPNGCTIESAFGRHGLAGTAFRDTTLGRPVVEGRRVSITVDTPTGTACPPAQVGRMRLHYRIGDAAVDVPMLPMGATWSAELPAAPAGTVIHYRVVAELDNAERFHFPDNPADPEYQLFVGAADEIWCERFDSDPMWKQDGDVEWEVAASSTGPTIDPSAPVAGAWLGTDLRGDGRYRPDILTSITTPEIDARSYARVHLQFRRWLTIEDSGHDVATVRINGTQIWANATAPAQDLDHVDKEWRFVDFDLTPFAAEPLAVTWTLASSPLRHLGGWNIDEVCIVGLDKQPRCGDGVVDDGEQCDDSSPDCVECELPDDGGCCSGSNGLPTLMFALLLQFVIFVRRR